MIRERTAFSFCASLAAHGIAFLLVLWGGYFLPSAAVRIGGPGGGSGGEAYAVGVVDDLSGGAGMVKPSIEPKPPALLDERPVPDKATAVPIPQSVEPRKPKISERERREAEKLKESKSNVIPTAAEAGSGGAGGAGGGGGGGRGGGIGVSIGAGSGGLGDSWYARAVEGRISSNWIQPPKGVTCEMVYSFFIAPDGTIFGIKKEKTSGNPELDLTAERAIRASNPLAPPPPEFRGRPVQFIAYFQYPPPP
jgi:membrane protein involved in colicin uptake